MASTLLQSNLTTVWTAASTTDGTTPGGPYNPIGTSTGEISTTRVGTTFQRNVLALISVVEFLIASTADPSSSLANQTLAGQQRKALKEMLAKAAMRVKTVAGPLDDRIPHAGDVTTKMIRQFNNDNRPDAL